jgi:hypothetical protein
LDALLQQRVDQVAQRRGFVGLACVLLPLGVFVLYVLLTFHAAILRPVARLAADRRSRPLSLSFGSREGNRS